MARPVSGQVSLASWIIMVFFMAPKRKANAAQSSPSKTKAAKASAEEAARVATGQVDPSCTVPGEYRRSQHERTLSILGYGELAGPPTLHRAWDVRCA